MDTIKTVDTEDERLSQHWETFAQQFARLGGKLHDRYQAAEGEQGPSEEEVRSALRTLGKAVDRMTSAFVEATRDPELRQQLKQTASSLAQTLGVLLEYLGRSAGGGAESVDQTGPG